MLREQDLQELIEFESEHPVLSVYLNFDPSRITAEQAKLQARQMLKAYANETPSDVEIIQTYIEQEYDSSGQGLVIFSCSPEDFLHVVKLPMPIRSRARLLPKPYVKPLAGILEHYGHYGIAVIDRQGLRAYHFHLGELSEPEGTMGDSVRHTKHGGGSQAAGRRGGGTSQAQPTEEIVERNLRESAQFAAAFFDKNNVRRVLIGGAEPTTQRFIDLLPVRWRSLVLSTFPLAMAAGHAQVLEKAMQVAEEAKGKHEATLVKNVLSSAASGRGASGLEETLQAVHAGNVQVLMIEEGFRAPGFRCTNCGHLSAVAHELCPFCSHTVEQIEDAVELAVQKILLEGGEVEIVPGSPEFERAGHIAALSRY